jgi:hypothetical protein
MDLVLCENGDREGMVFNDQNEAKRRYLPCLEVLTRRCLGLSIALDQASYFCFWCHDALSSCLAVEVACLQDIAYVHYAASLLGFPTL